MFLIENRIVGIKTRRERIFDIKLYLFVQRRKSLLNYLGVTRQKIKRERNTQVLLKYSRIAIAAAAPSPAAATACLTDPKRQSPAAKMPFTDDCC